MDGAVLIVEDDTALLHSLHDALTATGLTVGKAATGEYALRLLKLGDYNVVLLDLNMPGMGGMAACRAIREEHTAISIIVLTVRDEDEEKVEALNAGADDYVTKPFHLPELIARINAALRRSKQAAASPDGSICVGNISIDEERHVVTKRGVQVHLTPIEFDLLHLLMANAGKPLPHRTLLSSVWGPEYGDEREYLRTYVNQLRKKLEDDPSQPEYLLTEAYVGYRFAKTEH